jgi:hypothetical protein
VIGPISRIDDDLGAGRKKDTPVTARAASSTLKPNLNPDEGKEL